MTFKRFEEIFKSRYPDGTVYMHDEFSHGASGTRQKIAVIFAPGGKVYMYRGAYEDVLCRIGINTISKERLAELEIHVRDLRDRNGKPDMFFGGIHDCSDELRRAESRLEEVRRDYIIA